MKKIVTVLSCCIAACCLFAACGDKKPAPPDPNPGSTVALNETTKRIELFTAFGLQITVDGTAVTAAWSSADPAVASVDDGGLVTANRIGATEVTGAYGGKEYVCAVTVTPPPTAPNLSFAEQALELIVDKTDTVTPALVHLGQTLALGGSVSYASGDDTIFTAAKRDDFSCLVTGVSPGTATLEATFDWYGITLHAGLPVTVGNKKADIILSDTSLTLSTVDIEGVDSEPMTMRLSVQKIIFDGGDVSDFEDDIKWSIEGGFATVSPDGLVMGKTPGTTTVTATWIDPYGNEHEAYCQVTVVRTVVRPSASFKLYLEDDGCAIDVSPLFDVSGWGVVAARDVTAGGEKPLKCTQTDGAFAFDKKDLLAGDRVFELAFENGVAIVADVTVVSRRVGTKEQLLTLVQSEGTVNGYYELTADIDLGQTVIGGGQTDADRKTFAGVFDGQGHRIVGGVYEANGLFGFIAHGAAVRNVAVTGGTLNSRQVNTAGVKGNVVLAYGVAGKVDNVLVDVTVVTYLIFNSGLGWDAGGNAGSIFGRLDATAEISNLVLYWDVSHSIGSDGVTRTERNISDCATFINANLADESSADATLTNVHAFHSAQGERIDSTGITGLEPKNIATTCAQAGLDKTQGFNDYWDFTRNRAAFKQETLVITTAEQLMAFRDNTNLYNSIELGADINLGQTVIGGGEKSVDIKTFTGEFDGKGHRIVGGVYEANGLFGFIADGAAVRNVAIVGGTLNSRHPNVNDVKGSVVLGYGVAGRVDNVLVDVTVVTHLIFNSGLGWDAGGNAGSIFGWLEASAEISNFVLYWDVSHAIGSDGTTVTETNTSDCATFINPHFPDESSAEATLANVHAFHSAGSNGNMDGTGISGLTPQVITTTCAQAGLDSAQGFNEYWDFTGNRAAFKETVKSV